MVLVIFGPLPLCVYGVYGVGGCVWLLGVFMGVTFGMRPLWLLGGRETLPPLGDWNGVVKHHPL